MENSRTGTSIDIPIEFLKKIKPHIIFFSLGVDIHQGYSKRILKAISLSSLITLQTKTNILFL